MSKLKPWAAGPFELIRHAEGHLKAGSDFDKRMALISYDNAIEVSLTTFLQLHPSQRGGKTYERKKTEEWLTNYHKKLEFLELFAKEKGVSLQVSIDEVIYYHNLRNELYHSGNGLVPECSHLEAARTAALSVFSCLFGVDAEPLLEVEKNKVQAEQRPVISEQSAFLEAFIDLEKYLKSALYGMELVDHNFLKVSVRQAWDLFVENAGKVTKRFSGIVERAIRVRNAIVHGEPTGLAEGYLPGLTKGIVRITEFVGKYPTSIDILPELKKRHPDWIREELSSVRIIQRSGRTFLETKVSEKSGAVRDEKIERMDLCFLSEGASEEMNEMFSPEDTAFDNAQKFLTKMDPFSLMMVANLFRPEAEKVITAMYEPSGRKRQNTVKPITVIVEGDTDAQIVKSVVNQLALGRQLSLIVAHGKRPLFGNLKLYAQSFKDSAGIIVLVDSDTLDDAEIEAQKVKFQRTVGDSEHSNFRLVLAVPEIEAWLGKTDFKRDRIRNFNKLFEELHFLEKNLEERARAVPSLKEFIDAVKTFDGKAREH